MTTLSGRLRRAYVLVSTGVIFTMPFAAPARASEIRVGVATPVVRYADALRSFNPGLSSSQAQDMAAHVLLLSSYYSLDSRLLVAIVAVESNWRSHAVSPVGAQGLGQLMPSTADGLSVLAFDAYENLDGTARYLRRMMQRFGSLKPEARYSLALASYNAGPQAVARFGGVPPYAETRAYVQRVTTLWHRLATLLPANSAPATVLAHSGSRPPTARVVQVAVRPVAVHAPPRPMRRAGSVAEFTRLESQSLDELAFVAAPAPSPAPVVTSTVTPAAPRVSRGFKRWLSRAFGAR
jgi:hypothetical protein